LQQRLLAAADIELLLAAGEAAAALAAVDALIATTANLAADTAAGLDAVDAAGGANTAIFPAEPGAGAAPRVVPRLWHLRGLALAGAGRYLEAAAALAAALAAARRQGRLPLAAQTAAALTRVWTSANNPDLAAAYAAECRAIVTPLLARLPATGVPFPGASDQTLRRSAEAAAASWLHREALIAPKLPSPTLPLLTARETEVALLVARGLSNRAIADALVISERTAERHVANIMAKLNVNTRAQIAVYAAAGAHLPGE
jgi:DNA-binding CsgD family transcriptional regulator